MSQPRLHETLIQLFESKDSYHLTSTLEHADFLEFMSLHGVKMPAKELAQSFTHTSFSHEFQVPHQEQLEFLGDAVLQLVLTNELFKRFPLEKEGQLSKLRSSIVNEKTLSILARELHLGDLIVVGKGEFSKKLFEQDAVLADTLEALLGQIYRQQGFEFIESLLLNWLEKFLPQAFDMDSLEGFDVKSKLQEVVLAKYKKVPRYSSEANGDQFLIKLWINDDVAAEGIYPSKKTGEKDLASLALKRNEF